MSSTFNLPPVRRDPLGQALDQLPQFLLTLGRLQEAQKEREERARQANVQETAKKTAHEMQMIRMAGQVSNLTARAGTLPGVKKHIETPEGLQAYDVVATMTGMQLEQERLLEEEQAREAEDYRIWREGLDRMSDREVLEQTSLAGLTDKQQKAAEQEVRERKGFREQLDVMADESKKFKVKKLEGSIDNLLESKRLAGQPRLDSAGLQTGLHPPFSEEEETELQSQLSELSGLGVEYPSTFLDEPAFVVDEVTPEPGEKPKPRIFESRGEYQARLIEAGFGKGLVTMPEEDPLGLFK